MHFDTFTFLLGENVRHLFALTNKISPLELMPLSGGHDLWAGEDFIKFGNASDPTSVFIERTGLIARADCRIKLKENIFREN